MWMKIDDGFVEHEKTVAAGDALGGRHAVGRVVAVWVEAGLYACRRLTDGFVPQRIVAASLVDDDPLAVAEALVESGLWTKEDGGYRFHDWNDWNPSAAGVKDKRAKDLERKRGRKSGALNGHDPRGFLLEAPAILMLPAADSAAIPRGIHAESDAIPPAPVPVPVPVERSKAERQRALTVPPRAARMSYSVWEVRRHLLAAVHRMIDQGEPYARLEGGDLFVDIGAVGHELKRIAAHDLHATWNSSRELQPIVEAAIARRQQQHDGDLMRAAWERREQRALARLGWRS